MDFEDRAVWKSIYSALEIFDKVNWSAPWRALVQRRLMPWRTTPFIPESMVKGFSVGFMGVIIMCKELSSSE